jgi:hypothetical protein
MALIWRDRVAEVSTSTGTGNFTLAGALTSYRTFSSVCATNDTLYYVITAVGNGGEPTGDWETGLGTYSASNTLTRTTVLDSSNAGAAVNFGAGTKRVTLSQVSGSIQAANGVLHVRDEKSAGSDGGTFTAGAWQTRTLNTVITNTISGASLSSNQITLPAGIYDVQARAPGHQVETHQTRLQNITDAVTVILGTTVRSRATSATDGSADSTLLARLELTTTKVFELQHRCNTTGTTFGFGVGNANTWDICVFASVHVRAV